MINIIIINMFKCCIQYFQSQTAHILRLVGLYLCPVSVRCSLYVLLR